MSPIVSRIIIIVFLLLIVGSLASALYYLVKDKGSSDRTVKALTVRVTLSVTLFLLLLAGFYFGIIPARH
ncbi:MAG: twin transmembrane helix small protein [Burkholderiales bacterium]|nr:twin transmembrane helix small protein [Burkholderiales bacterium]